MKKGWWLQINHHPLYVIQKYLVKVRLASCSKLTAYDAVRTCVNSVQVNVNDKSDCALGSLGVIVNNQVNCAPLTQIEVREVTYQELAVGNV